MNSLIYSQVRFDRDPMVMEVNATIVFNDGLRDSVTLELPYNSTEAEILDAVEHELVRVYGTTNYEVTSVEY
jgi:hypothetical protein